MKKRTLTQQEFLRDAKTKLNLTWTGLAIRIGAPETTLKKWTLPEDDGDNFREMPSTMWILIREILEHEALKAKHQKLLEKMKKSA